LPREERAEDAVTDIEDEDDEGLGAEAEAGDTE
jgi:hypothetical protein